jgi:hypothetical protein
MEPCACALASSRMVDISPRLTASRHQSAHRLRTPGKLQDRFRELSWLQAHPKPSRHSGKSLEIPPTPPLHQEETMTPQHCPCYVTGSKLACPHSCLHRSGGNCLVVCQHNRYSRVKSRIHSPYRFSILPDDVPKVPRHSPSPGHPIPTRCIASRSTVARSRARFPSISKPTAWRHCPVK